MIQLSNTYSIEVSIIIINYNTCQMTARCIESIYEQTKNISFEIILVDNASKDGSKELFQNDERVKYLYQNENLGFGKANNIGMKVANGEYFFLLNSDTLLVNNAIKLFYDYAKNHSRKLFYGCWLEDMNGKFIHSGGEIPNIRFFLWNLCKSYIPGRYQGDGNVYFSSEECFKIGYITGADMFFHRSIFEQTKGFDPHFFMYYEEADWQRSASKLGFDSYILKGPQIIHLEGGSQKKENHKMNVGRFERFMISQYYYVRKDNSYIIYFLYRTANAILYMPKLLLGRSASSKTSLKAIKILFKSIKNER